MDHKKLYEMEKLFQKFNGYLKTKDFLSFNFTSYYLSQLKKENFVMEVKRGLYRWNDYNLKGFEELVDVSKIVPKGVFCLFSALFYYDLSSFVPLQYYIAINRNSSRPTPPEYPPIKLKFFSGKYFSKGIENININGNIVKIYNIEKTICDCIRFKNEIGKDTLKEALHDYALSPKKNISRLMRYGKMFRIEKKLKIYLETIL